MADEALLAAFKKAGLKDADARHLMYAVHSGCNRFVTTDPDSSIDAPTWHPYVGVCSFKSHPNWWPNCQSAKNVA
jgi:hypothetical protein